MIRWIRRTIKKIIPPVFFDLWRMFQKDKYKDLYNKYKDYTMIDEKTFIGNLKLAEHFSKHNTGCVVECGVWRGGMSAAMAEIYENNKKYYLFDSFEGLPEAQEIDGKAAINWQSDKEGPIYFDNCTAEMNFAEKAMKLSSVTNFKLIKGWFSETLPKFECEENIAVLRLDGDWYDSTMDCLNNLYDKVSVGGVIIIDDYYAWDGCTRAVHDYLSMNKLTVKIRQNEFHVCFIIKE